MNQQDIKQLDDLKAMRQASRHYHNTAVRHAVEIGNVGLERAAQTFRMQRRKPSLIKRILGGK